MPRGVRRKRCSIFECPILLENICCADCRQKETCKYVCKNQPNKCGLVEDRKEIKK